MTRLLIARHGNTFDKGDVIRRVGLGTDLPLSESGKEQARLLGDFLKEKYSEIAAVYTSQLQRTYQTAEIALGDVPMARLSIFNEIHYGPDEGKPEDEVIARLGKEALELWDTQAIPPQGWKVDPQKIEAGWKDFAKRIVKEHPEETVLVVTSNGVARFAPAILPDPAAFKANNNIKLSTGALASLVYKDGQWSSEFWNLKPKDHFAKQA